MPAAAPINSTSQPMNGSIGAFHQTKNGIVAAASAKPKPNTRPMMKFPDVGSAVFSSLAPGFHAFDFDEDDDAVAGFDFPPNAANIDFFCGAALAASVSICVWTTTFPLRTSYPQFVQRMPPLCISIAQFGQRLAFASAVAACWASWLARS